MSRLLVLGLLLGFCLLESPPALANEEAVSPVDEQLTRQERPESPQDEITEPENAEETVPDDESDPYAAARAKYKAKEKRMKFWRPIHRVMENAF